MFRIGDQQFSDYQEADEWAHNNIGGCYSIEPLTFCHTCADHTDDGDRCEVCGGYKGADGEFHGGNKLLAKTGTPYWKMKDSHKLYELSRWVFGFKLA